MVQSIGAEAFARCISLTGILIPDSVTTLGGAAFAGCTSLIHAVVGNSVTELCDYWNWDDGFEYGGIFFDCRSLTFVSLGSSIRTIGDSTFQNCSSLAEIVIPESVTSIKQEAFFDCSSLTEVIIPEGVTSIDWNAFWGCSSLTEVVIPDSVISIGNDAFNGCTALKNISLGSGLSSLGENVFSYCTALSEFRVDANNPSYRDIDGVLFSKNGTQLILYPKGRMGAYAIPEGVKTIAANAFSDCNSLTQVIIPDSFTSIGAGAFTSCGSLTEVIIPESVKSIGYQAFYNCYSLRKIYFLGTTPPTANNSAFESCPEDIIICYPVGSESAWGSEWHGYSTQSWGLPETISVPPLTYTRLDNTMDYTVSACDPNYSGTLFIPESMNYEGIPCRIISIGESAFAGCAALQKLIIPASIATVEVNAFADCFSLTDIYFESQTPPAMENSAFLNCPVMTFYYPAGSEANWGTEWQGFPTQAWSLPEALVIEPLTYTQIGKTLNYAVSSFDNEYSGLLSIPDLMEYEGIPCQVTLIKNSVFNWNSSLTKIILPGSVSVIEDYAFQDVHSLREVYFLSTTPPDAQQSAFSGCYDMTVYYPSDSQNNWESSWNGFPAQPWELPEILSLPPLTYQRIGMSRNYEVAACDSNCAGTLLIPDSIEYEGFTCPVIAIGENALSGLDSLTAVFIPENITTIGENAFADCVSLETIGFNTKTPPLTGEFSFENCPAEMIILYPAGSEVNWGTEWQGFAAQAWNPEETPIVLYVTAEDTARFYHTENPELTYFITDASGAPVNVEGAPVLSTPALPESPIGNYPITIEQGTLDDNYAYTFLTGILTINPPPLTVTADSLSRFYDTENPVLTYVITDAEGTVVEIPGTPELSTTASPESVVGEYPITITQGTLDPNYSYTFVNGILTVTQIPVIITAEDKSRPYLADNPILTYVITDIEGTVIEIPGTPALSTTAAPGSVVGEYPITIAQGTLDSNYSYTFVEGTLIITQVPLIAAVENKSRPYRAENPVLTYVITDTEGAVVEIPGTPELITSAVPESPVGTYPILIAQGTLDNNYSYTFVEGSLTITQAPATVIAENKSRPYHGDNPELTYTITDAAGSLIEIPGIPELSTTAALESSVGEYPIAIAQGSLDAVNYSYTFVNGTLTVTQAPATVTAENKNRPYHGDNPELTYTITDAMGTFREFLS